MSVEMPRVVGLHLVVARERKRRWAFWQRRRARVFAWLRALSEEEARRLAEAEMARRGWTIVRVESIRWNPEEPHPDFFVRQQQRVASRWGASYFFDGVSEQELEEAGSRERPPIRSRYAEVEGVLIDPERLPAELRAVIPAARQWAIGDDEERAAFRASVSAEKKRDLVDLVEPLLEAIEAYCDSLRQQLPVPDEVVLLDMMAESYAEVRAEIGEPPAGRQAP